MPGESVGRLLWRGNQGRISELAKETEKVSKEIERNVNLLSYVGYRAARGGG